MSYEHQISTLTKLASYQKQALNNGYRAREEMHQAIEAGVEPDNYRIDELKSAVIKIFRLLEQIAVDFNEAHPGDRYSSLDLSDVLVSALNTLQTYDKD